jgi:putative membrane protein
MMWGHGWGGGWGFHPIFGLLALVGLVVVATWIVRLVTHGSLRHHHGEMSGGKRALEILEERFARGEIGKEEFVEKRSLIER